jgi:hypothetical protein
MRCAKCHAKFDPYGLALENFDVAGGWREQYRILGSPNPQHGIGKNGQRFAFALGPSVDPSGELDNGQHFADVRELKKMLTADPVPLARNMASQLLTYATGEPPGFADRDDLDAIVTLAKAQGYGVRSIVLAVIESPMFLHR